MAQRVAQLLLASLAIACGSEAGEVATGSAVHPGGSGSSDASDVGVLGPAQPGGDAAMELTDRGVSDDATVDGAGTDGTGRDASNEVGRARSCSGSEDCPSGEICFVGPISGSCVSPSTLCVTRAPTGTCMCPGCTCGPGPNGIWWCVAG